MTTARLVPWALAWGMPSSRVIRGIMITPPPSPTRPPKIPEINPIRKLIRPFSFRSVTKPNTKRALISTPECRLEPFCMHPEKDKNI